MIMGRSPILSSKLEPELAFFHQHDQNKSMEEKHMIISMTGYGRSEIQINGKKLVTEIRSVNHRFLEVVIKFLRAGLLLRIRSESR